MRQLVFKDLYFLRAMWIFYLGFSTFLFISNLSDSSVFAASCLVSTLASLILTMAQDEKNDSEKLLNSLPLERRDIVIAKYIVISMIAIIAILATLAVVWMIRGLTTIEDIALYHPYLYIELPWYTVLKGIAAPFLYAAFFLPVYYSTDSKILRGVLAILIVLPLIIISLFIDGSQYGVEASFGDWISNMSNVGICIVGAIGLMALYIISMFTAIRLYEKRDV
ncbi:ABC-2 transporter permease [Bacillus sp. JJ1127]|uniref:ABC-2 transporter permease n=1 Tax=Bacillus sp. JJ1127 TaxID=3122952 RepID=UPI002FFFD694